MRVMATCPVAVSPKIALPLAVSNLHYSDYFRQFKAVQLINIFVIN